MDFQVLIVLNQFDINIKEENKWNEEISTAEAAEVVEVVDSAENQERCTKLNVLTVVRKLKCLSNRILTDRYTAGNAIRATDHLKNTK